MLSQEAVVAGGCFSRFNADLVSLLSDPKGAGGGYGDAAWARGGGGGARDARDSDDDGAVAGGVGQSSRFNAFNADLVSLLSNPKGASCGYGGAVWACGGGGGARDARDEDGTSDEEENDWSVSEHKARCRGEAPHLSYPAERLHELSSFDRAKHDFSYISRYRDFQNDLNYREFQNVLHSQQWDKPMFDGGSVLRRACVLREFDIATRFIEELKAAFDSESDQRWAVNSDEAQLAFLLASSTHPMLAACFIDAGTSLVGTIDRRYLDQQQEHEYSQDAREDCVTGLQRMCGDAAAPQGQPQLIQ